MKLFTKSKCKTCRLIKEYFAMKNIHFEEINIDKRIPAELVQLMSSPTFPQHFEYPIFLNDKNEIWFGKDIFNKI